MGVQVTSYDIPLYTDNHIWLDPVFGDDDSAEVDRIDAPFQTFTAAWLARRALGSACVVIHISNGNYNITDPIDVSGVKDTVFLCESTTECVITYDNSGNTGANLAMFTEVISGLNIRSEIYMIGGTWTRTGIGTGIRMFEVIAARANFWIYDANINDLIGTQGVFWHFTTKLVKNCRVISTVGSIFQGSTSQSNIVRLEDSYLECNGDIVLGARSGFTFTRCKMVSLTAGFFDALINNSFIFTDCYVQQFSAVGRNRGGVWGFRGFNKFEATGNRRVFWTDSQTYNGYYRNIGTLIACPFYNSNGPVWTHQGSQARRWLNAGTFIYPETQLFGTGDAYPSGRIGTRLGSSTIGAIINMDCVANNGVLWDRDRLVYNVTSASIPDTLDGMRDMIRNRILTEGPGNPWWEFTKGDINRVYNDGVDDLRVDAAPNCALGFQISATTQYFNGVDTTIDLNFLPTGLTDGIGGNYLALERQPILYGGTERIIDRLEPVLNYRDI